MEENTAYFNTSLPRDHVDYISQETRLVMQAIFSAISIIGVLGNLLTIFSVLLNKKLKSIPNVYICNLAIADLIVTGAISPFSAFIFTQDINDWYLACTLISAINLAMLGATMFCLTAIAINRYILLVKGSSVYTKLYTRRKVAISIFILWLLPLLMITPIIAGFGKLGYNVKMGSCVFQSDDSSTYMYVQIFTHGCCVVPCASITMYCYVKIILHFRRTQRRLHKSMQTSSALKSPSIAKHSLSSSDESKQATEDYELSSSGPSNNNTTSDQIRAKRSRASRRVVMNLCTVFMVFIMCWSPLVSVYTVDYHGQVPAIVYHIFYSIAVSNSCLNVFIYAGMNRAFRKSYKEIVTCKFASLNSSL